MNDGYKEVKIGPTFIPLPRRWSIKKLEHITDVRSSNVNKKSKNTEIPVRLCNYLDVYKNEYINNNINFMKATAKKREVDRFTIEQEDVIITKDSETDDDIGVPAVVSENLSGVLCGYHLTLLKSKPNSVSGYFLAKVLQSEIVRNQFYRKAQGLTRYSLTVGSIKNTLIPIPPLPEQKKIATILSTVDKALEKTTMIIDKTKRLKKGLMQRLLTKGIGHEEFKEVRIDVKKHKIPIDWQAHPLHELIELRNGKSNPKKNLSNSYSIPVYGGNGITGYYNSPLMKRPTIIIGRVGEYCGSIHLVKERCWITDNAIYLKDIKEKQLINIDFLAFYLKYKNLNRLSNRTGQPKLTQSRILSVEIPIPPLPEQKQIASILTSVVNKIQKEQEYKQQLQQLKKGLMQQLLTGRRRVQV